MKLIAFITITFILYLLFRRKIKTRSNPAFYIFLACEGSTWLLITSFRYWIINPLKTKQLVSWTLLLISAGLLLISLSQFKKWRTNRSAQLQSSAFIQQPQKLFISTGIYSYIRHPMYCALICLIWSLFFKYIRFDTFLIAVFSSLSIFRAANLEESLNVEKFGSEYKKYMANTKMFFPMIF